MKLNGNRKTKIAIYRTVSVQGHLVPSQHGPRTQGWGHTGYKYGYILYVRDNKGKRLFIKSLPLRVYRTFVKSIVSAVAAGTTRCCHCGRQSYLANKPYKPPYSNSTISLNCEYCGKG